MRIAAFQRRPIFDDPGQSVDTIVRDVTLASARGIDLALFPESYLQGHSYDRSRVEQRALSLDDKIVQALAERLSGVRPDTVVGLFERRGSDIYNSAVVIAGGRVAGVYAKAFPIEDGCAPGDLFPVWRRHGWTFGINICNDLNFPEAAERLTDQGAALICCPLNMMLRPKKAERWRSSCIENLQACAKRTECWVMSADVAGHNDDGWISYGCTAIVRPDGTIAARAAELAEDVIEFDLPDV